MRAADGVDLELLAPGLRRDADGVWRAAARREVSYPRSGYAECLAVEDDSYWFGHRNGVLGDLVARFPPDGPIFDVGGGNGAVSRALASAGREVVLVEPGAAGVVNARRRGVETVIEATFEDAGFRDGSLPAIGLFDVVEHVADDQAFLARLARALAPGGRLYVTVPAHRWLWSEEDVYAGHFRRYRARDLRRTLRTAGLRPEWDSHFFAPLPLPIFAARTVPSLLRRGRRVDVTAAQAQHRAGGSLAGRLLLRLLAAERRRLARGRRLPVGSSLVAVARRASAA